MDKKRFKAIVKKTWWFIWEDDSIWSWIVNVVLAFVLIKFIVYPGLGFLLSTSYPIVAVVSSSMEHDGSFDNWWDSQEQWYLDNGISEEQFSGFSFKHGFNKGDIMILRGKKANEIEVGQVIVFVSARERPRADPIIHRVVKRWENDGKTFFQTKGDHNPSSISGCDNTGCLHEKDIREDQYLGNAVIRVPLLGYVKIWFVELINLVLR